VRHVIAPGRWDEGWPSRRNRLPEPFSIDPKDAGNDPTTAIRGLLPGCGPSGRCRFGANILSEQKFDHRRQEKPMFDHLAWRQECYERNLFGLDDEEELDDEEFWVDLEEQLPLPDG
jgi:hypothetical protein